MRGSLPPPQENPLGICNCLRFFLNFPYPLNPRDMPASNNSLPHVLKGWASPAVATGDNSSPHYYKESQYKKQTQKWLVAPITK